MAAGSRHVDHRLSLNRLGKRSLTAYKWMWDPQWAIAPGIIIIIIIIIIFIIIIIIIIIDTC